MEGWKRRNLDEGVAVLGSEVDGEHEAALRVARAEMRGGGVEEHARAFAPDFAGARDEFERGVELPERRRGTEQSAFYDEREK